MNQGIAIIGQRHEIFERGAYLGVTLQLRFEPGYSLADQHWQLFRVQICKECSSDEEFTPREMIDAPGSPGIGAICCATNSVTHGFRKFRGRVHSIDLAPHY